MPSANLCIEVVLLSIRLAMLAAFVVLASVLLSGCGRTVLVPESIPLRIGPKIKGRVYALTDGEWTLSSNCVEIPEGWYCVPPSYVEEDDR